MEQYAKLPCNKDYQRAYKQRACKKAVNKHKRRKHHKMVPVENAAGSTATRFHHQSERAPEKNAYKVANVKRYANHKKYDLVYDFRIIKRAKHREQCYPQKHNPVSRLGNGADIASQCLTVYLFANRSEPLLKYLH